MPRPTWPRRATSLRPPLRLPLRRLRAALALVLLAAMLTIAGAAATSTAASSAAEPPRTWVVDAVDDTQGNRWDAVDTGTSVVTIRVGDTVEWQFDRATQGHDLTSLAPAQPWETVWPTALQEYRDPGGPSVTYTFDEPGTYRYQCSLHGPMMTGTIVVVPADGDNQPPTAAPVVEPLMGPAPHVVHATANASDPDSDEVSIAWEFGTGGAPTYTDHAMFEYTTPGTYVVRLRVSDSRGGLHVEEFTGHRHRGRPARPGPADRRHAPGDRRARRAGPGHRAARRGVLDPGHHPGGDPPLLRRARGLPGHRRRGGAGAQSRTDPTPR